MSFFKRCLPILVFALLAVLVLPQVLLACPTCKDSLAGDPAAASMARAYQYSILFMMAMPYLILLFLGSYFYWEIRRARKFAAQSRPLADRGAQATAELAEATS